MKLLYALPTRCNRSVQNRFLNASCFSLFPKLSARAIPFKPVTKPEHNYSSATRDWNPFSKICFSFPKHTTCYFSYFFSSTPKSPLSSVAVTRSANRFSFFYYQNVSVSGRKNHRPSDRVSVGVTHTQFAVCFRFVGVCGPVRRGYTYIPARVCIFMCYTYIIVVVPVDLDGLKKKTNNKPTAAAAAVGQNTGKEKDDRHSRRRRRGPVTRFTVGPESATATDTVRARQW